jgi:release factor glutamine methyltransferase
MIGETHRRLEVSAREPHVLDLRSALREGMARLREAGTPSEGLAAELLLMHALGRDRAWFYAHPEELLDAATAGRYSELVTRRASGEPTQYLTGRQEFWGLEFEVTPDVLIPRPETEHVVEVALERIGAAQRQAPLTIADVGTGSGCLAVALARELKDSEIIATDISEPALVVARRNAKRHGVEARIQFERCNLLDVCFDQDDGKALVPEDASYRAAPFSPVFDLIVSNPPYIGRGEAADLPQEVREHEPTEALFGGELGAELYAPLITQARKLLCPGGALVLELGYDSLSRVRPLFDSPAWTDVRVTNDLAGNPRVLSALRA